MPGTTPLRVLALVPSLYGTSPGQRFRMEQWAPRLAADGIDVEFSSFETPALRQVLYSSGNVSGKLAGTFRGFRTRVVDVGRASRYDLVYIFREAALLGPAVIERALAARHIPCVFDFDDAVFERYVSPSNGYLSYLKFPGKTRTVCRLARQVMAGNPYLASWAAQFADHVTVIPTTIDTDVYVPAGRPPSAGPLTIGWSGSYSTVQHLMVTAGPLAALATRRPFRLLVIGAPGHRVAGVETNAMAWRAETEVADLRQIDIGIMPLPDDRWSRGKCGLKALQYMALGIPTVCSPVGVNTEIVQHGENGLLADGPDEWVTTLGGLIDSASQRAALGAAGRRTVKQRYSTAVVVPRVVDVLREAAGRA
jgi:glycosyltransferase involved in cell wall biosynthesis